MKDLDFAGLGKALSSMARSLDEVQHGIAHTLGEAIKERAKGKLGEYQPESHGFEAWAPLSGVTMQKRALAGYPANNPLLVTGELSESIEMRVDGNGAIIGSKSDIALYQENGTENIPPRPFLGPAAYEVMDEAPKLTGKIISAALRK